jgi:hypothetical protein
MDVKLGVHCVWMKNEMHPCAEKVIDVKDLVMLGD